MVPVFTGQLDRGPDVEQHRPVSEVPIVDEGGGEHHRHADQDEHALAEQEARADVRDGPGYADFGLLPLRTFSSRST